MASVVNSALTRTRSFVSKTLKSAVIKRALPVLAATALAGCGSIQDNGTPTGDWDGSSVQNRTIVENQQGVQTHALPQAQPGAGVRVQDAFTFGQLTATPGWARQSNQALQPVITKNGLVQNQTPGLHASTQAALAQPIVITSGGQLLNQQQFTIEQPTPLASALTAVLPPLPANPAPQIAELQRVQSFTEIASTSALPPKVYNNAAPKIVTASNTSALSTGTLSTSTLSAVPTIQTGDPALRYVSSQPRAVRAIQPRSKGVVADFGSVKTQIGLFAKQRGGDIARFYSNRGNEPAWYGRSGWTSRAWDAKDALENSINHGLPSSRYLAIGNLPLPMNGDVHQIASAELALTQGMMKFVVDVSDGVNPKNRKTNGRVRLAEGVKQSNLASWIDSLAPSNTQYRGLQRAMASGGVSGYEQSNVIASMERFRQYKAPTFGRYITVNIPTQELVAYENGDVALRMPVVIGQLTRQTPVMEDRIVNLKFSPDWTVPSSVAKKDIIPILKSKGSNLLDSMNLKVRKNGKTVDGHKVKWSKVSANSSTYSFYQPAGPKNALGGVRFSLTNSHGIYLHDTPDTNLFGSSDRLLSSGCVRVGDAGGLATWILKNQGWSESKVRSAMHKGKTNIVSLKKSIPVRFTYYTAQVDGSGKLQTGSDVYGLDEAMSQVYGY